MKKVGIFGGSYNPIHIGHLALANYLCEYGDLDEVWFMVSPQNPFKANSSDLWDDQFRLELARLAVEEYPKFHASDFEFHLPRPNYTANTLRALKKAYPEHNFTLIIGEDNLEIFQKWRDYQYILEHYRIFVYPRRHCVINRLPVAKDLQILQNAPYFDISSTEIRKNLHI